MLHLQLSTVLFQLLNFFVLLAVLTRFFYRPLLRTMRAREAEVAKTLADAAARASAADAERARLAEERQRARVEADAGLARARADAGRLRDQLLEHARADAARLLEGTRQRLAEEERSAQQRVAERARRTALAIAEGLLVKAAGPALHEALVRQLLEGGLEADDRQGALLRRALANGDGVVTVELARPATPGLAERLGALLATLGKGGRAPRVEVRVEPSLLAGVRLLVGTVAVDLSLRGTLAELRDEREPSEA